MHLNQTAISLQATNARKPVDEHDEHDAYMHLWPMDVLNNSAQSRKNDSKTTETKTKTKAEHSQYSGNNKVNATKITRKRC